MKKFQSIFPSLGRCFFALDAHVTLHSKLASGNDGKKKGRKSGSKNEARGQTANYDRPIDCAALEDVISGE